MTESRRQGQVVRVLLLPADFTFVCPTELGDMADYGEFQKLGVEVSVSTDTHFVPKGLGRRVRNHQEDHHPCWATPTGTISRNFDVMIEEGFGAARRSFVVEPEGVVKVAEINDLGIGRDALSCCARSGLPSTSPTGQVCPAKWQEGRRDPEAVLDLVGKDLVASAGQRFSLFPERQGVSRRAGRFTSALHPRKNSSCWMPTSEPVASLSDQGEPPGGDRRVPR